MERIRSGAAPVFAMLSTRLEHERLVRWIGEHHLVVHTAVPAVSDRVRDNLPPAAVLTTTSST